MNKRMTWYVLGAAALLVAGAALADAAGSGALPADPGGEPERGWDGPIAIAIAAALAWGVHRGAQVWRERGSRPSPTPAVTAGVKKMPQVSPVSVSGVRGRDTSRRRRDEYVEIGAGGGRIYPPDDLEDDEIDLALDEDVPVPVRKPAGPPRSLEQYVDELDREGVQRKDIRTSAMERYGVSQSTVDRAVRDARKKRRPA